MLLSTFKYIDRENKPNLLKRINNTTNKLSKEISSIDKERIKRRKYARWAFLNKP